MRMVSMYEVPFLMRKELCVVKLRIHETHFLSWVSCIGTSICKNGVVGLYLAIVDEGPFL